MKNLIRVIVALLLSSRIEAGEGERWIKPDSVTISCADYFSLITPYGVLTNNVWNKQAAQSDDWSQCLEKRITNGVVQFGWSWSWPFGRKVIYAQPQIKIGASPWAPEPKFDDSFPLRISDLQRLDISHKLEVQTTGDHNTTTTMWLIKENYQGSEPNKSVIAAEIMIWTYASPGHLDPAGRKLGKIKIRDTSWDVWYQKDWDDKSGVNDNKWVIVSFRAKEFSMSARIPGLELLEFAVKKNLIPEDLYIADVELGNEIMSGSGVAWVEEFSVAYEKKSPQSATLESRP